MNMDGLWWDDDDHVTVSHTTCPHCGEHVMYTNRTPLHEYAKPITMCCTEGAAYQLLTKGETMQQCTYITEEGQCQTPAMEGDLMCGPHYTRSMLDMGTEVKEAYDKRMDFYGTHTYIPTVLDAHPPVEDDDMDSMIVMPPDPAFVCRTCGMDYSICTCPNPYL